MLDRGCWGSRKHTQAIRASAQTHKHTRIHRIYAHTHRTYARKERIHTPRTHTTHTHHAHMNTHAHAHTSAEEGGQGADLPGLYDGHMRSPAHITRTCSAGILIHSPTNANPFHSGRDGGGREQEGGERKRWTTEARSQLVRIRMARSFIRFR